MTQQPNGLRNSNLLLSGYIKRPLPLPKEAREALQCKDWKKLDQLIFKYTSPGGLLFRELQECHSFKHVEHIIALRDAETDEDGIWHDDGSRHIAFTWSLNEAPENLEGGELFIRKKGCRGGEVEVIEPPIVGTFLVFLTGQYGFEHKVAKVTKGTRKTIAGWCSEAPLNF